MCKMASIALSTVDWKGTALRLMQLLAVRTSRILIGSRKLYLSITILMKKRITRDFGQLRQRGRVTYCTEIVTHLMDMAAKWLKEHDTTAEWLT